MTAEASGLPSPVMAVDIGGTTTRAALVQGQTLLTRLEMPTEAPRGPDDLIVRLLALIRQLGVEDPGLGVACTGQVQGDRVSAVNTATMPGWVNIPLRSTLADALGVPVTVLNDAKAATLAEYAATLRQGNFMFVTVSTGIGSGLVLGGHLHDSPDGRDVGLGFTHGLNGEPLEYGSSGRGLDAAARAGGFADVRALFDAAEGGDDTAQQALHAPLTALAQRISDADRLLGLQTLCLGGSVGLRAYTLDFLRRRLPGMDVQPARFGADAGLIGAARHVQAGGGRP